MSNGIMNRNLDVGLTYKDWSNIVIACALASTDMSLQEERRKDLLRIANDIDDIQREFKKIYDEEEDK